MMRPSHSPPHTLFTALALTLGVFALPVCVVQVPAVQAAEPSRVQLAAANQPLPADGAFQVTIEVFATVDGQNNQLQDRHLVIFQNGKAYDFSLFEPRDVTVIDPAKSQVTLLSRVNHVQSTIASEALVRTAAQLRVYAKNQQLEERLGINAKTQRVASQPGAYQISFSDFQYQATAAAPKMGHQPARFAEFTDAVARVNLIRRLGTPPFARIDLGRTIAADGLIPETVTLQIQSGNHKRTFLSRYTFKNDLSPESQKRLDEVAGMMTLYREVPLPAFP